MSEQDRDKMAARILASIAALPFHKQADAIHNLIGAALPRMPAGAIREMRAEIAEQFSDEIPIVGATLDLLDGHLALREIHASSDSEEGT